MVATVLINEKNGGGETPTDKTSGTVRFKNADDAVVDTNDRLIIPTSGQEYSFRKVLRLQITVSPDVDIANVQFYSDGLGSFGEPAPGVKVWYQIGAAYVTPAVPSEANDPPEFPGATPMLDFFLLTSGAPGDGDGNNTGPFSSTGDIADYINFVMEVETSAIQGQLAPETLTFSFDET